MKAGFEDPAETGIWYGGYVAVTSVLAKSRRIDIRFEPHFTGAMLEMDGSVRLRSSAARILGLLMVSLATFPYVAVFMAWRRMKNVRP